MINVNRVSSQAQVKMPLNINTQALAINPDFYENET